MPLASGWVGPMVPPAVQSLRRGLSTNPGVTMWVPLKKMPCECYREPGGDLASTVHMI